MSERKDDPSTTSTAYDMMSPLWDKIATVLGGTSAMRAAGEKYLPKHEQERDKSYKNRLDRATLYNAAQITLDSWVGRPFSDPIKATDVPKELEALLPNVDLQGNSIGVFARNWFREGLAKALAHVLVDHPTQPEGVVRTMADDAVSGVRPYWVFVRPEDLIFAAFDVIGGREVLTHARMRERQVTRDGFEERLVERIRVFDRRPEGVFFSVYEKEEKKDRWNQVQGETRMDIDEIPLVTFYADRAGPMLGKPPLEDLTDLNVAHWQSKADQDNIVTVARFPILGVSGAVEDPNSPIVIGPRKVLSAQDPATRYYYVEHSGAAISAGRQHTLDIEEQMAHYGAEYLTKRPGSETATARALDSAESTSPLQDAAHRFNEALVQVLRVTAKWLKVDETKVGKLEVVTDYGPEEANQVDVGALTQARVNRDLSRKQFLKELKRRGILPDEFDLDENDRELEDEPLDGAALGAPIDPQAEDERRPAGRFPAA